MVVGFSGTEHGMTPPQKAEAHRLLIKYGATELHHGNCCGADEEMAVFAHANCITTIAHPGADTPDKRASFVSILTFPPKGNIKRNHDIVDVCDILIAAPEGDPKLRSGTWATVRYADKVGRDTIIVTPKGEIV